MIVTAALCWWNERPEDLTACVEALDGLVNRIVAIDGAYVRYPRATRRSPTHNVVAIREAAERSGIEPIILQPDDRLWDGQVQKRSVLIAEAARGSDWVMMLDADHIAMGDRAAVRRVLESTRADSVDVIFRTPFNEDTDEVASRWHIQQAKLAQYTPMFFRALPGLHYEKKHWWLSGKKDDQWVWLWGGDGYRPPVHHHSMSPTFWIEHRTLFRTRWQVLASRAFCNDREMVVRLTGQEDNQPGLPRPVFDYERMPA